MKKNEDHTFYNFQFKHAVVSITNHLNILSVGVAESLNIHLTMLCRWRQEMRERILENNDQEARSRDKLLAAQNKITKLESELKRVRAENNVLKKQRGCFLEKSRCFSVYSATSPFKFYCCFMSEVICGAE